MEATLFADLKNATMFGLRINLDDEKYWRKLIFLIRETTMFFASMKKDPSFLFVKES